jgi:hypothetical protein
MPDAGLLDPGCRRSTVPIDGPARRERLARSFGSLQERLFTGPGAEKKIRGHW